MKRIIAIMAAMLAIAACGGESGDGIVGTWNDSDEGITMQFLDDGTYIFEEGNDDLTGTYEIIDETTIHLEITEPMNDEMVAQYEFDGETLVLINPSGERATMTRVN